MGASDRRGRDSAQSVRLATVAPTHTSVLEEYLIPPSLPDATTAAKRQTIVLSAKTDEALRQRAEQLRNHLAPATTGTGEIATRADVRLAEIAYTLQVGRDAMPERLAIIVSDLTELREKLGGFLGGDSPVVGLYRGTVLRPDRESETLAAHSAPLEDLAQAWVHGAEVDWRSFYGKVPPRRIPLPVYPFARERCWIQIHDQWQRPRSDGNGTVASALASEYLEPSPVSVSPLD